MGNPQHLDWLLEGVKAWNARRLREAFRPDFEQVDIRQAFSDAGKLDSGGLIPLRGADLGGADLWGADLRGAHLRTVYSGAGANDLSAPEYTNLSKAIDLKQEQLEDAHGDTGVILPEGLVHPKDWPDPVGAEPRLPGATEPEDIAEGNGKLRLVDLAPPHRDDLANIHEDLREDVVVLRGSGSLDNISRGFDTVFARFAKIVDREYDAMDQTRFGVQAGALRKRLEGQREEIGAIDAGKLGELDAILMAAELLAARLPEWQVFLAETQGERGAIEAEVEAVDDALEQASKVMEADPVHFDGSLSERLREYWDTKTTEAYLAGVGLLNDAAFVVFRAVRDFTRDTGTETRKIAVKGLATALVSGLGSVLAKLAGIIPAELEWVLPWLKYIPVVFG